MIVNSIRNYLGELHQIKCRILRDKYCADVSGGNYRTNDPVEWLNKYYIPFLELPKIKPLMDGNGQPRDIRESEDGEWTGLTNPRGKNVGILLSYPFNSSIPLDTPEIREHHYAETIYNIVFSMGWFEEILEGLHEDVLQHHFRETLQTDGFWPSELNSH